MKLNENGQCSECLVKPLPYKGSYRSTRQKFCVRCYRSFNYDSGEFMPNWAWLTPTEKK